MTTDQPKTSRKLRVVDVLRFVFVLALPFSLFLIAGRWNWWQAWVYILVSMLASLISRQLVIKKHPDLLFERAKFTSHEGVPAWDRYLVYLVVYLPMLILVVAALDLRYGWSEKGSLAAHLIGLIMILIGSALASWAFYTNQFFSSITRIQKDRGHYVIDQGPYALMRHPGYAGGLISMIALPIFTGSVWAWIPCAMGMIAILLRTYLEDRFLQKELPGYSDYAGRVKFRIIPGIW